MHARWCPKYVQGRGPQWQGIWNGVMEGKKARRASRMASSNVEDCTVGGRRPITFPGVVMTRGPKNLVRRSGLVCTDSVYTATIRMQTCTALHCTARKRGIYHPKAVATPDYYLQQDCRLDWGIQDRWAQGPRTSTKVH